jgi:hypothetical protein
MARRARRRRARGHVSILFAVALLFICALVFFVIGVGQRYLQKETVQGAADAAAFSAAVAEAKVFNTVAFINLVLSIGVAIVYTLDAIMGGLIGFATTIAGLVTATAGTYCIGDPESCAYAAGPSEALAARYGEAATAFTERLQPLARAAKQVAKMGSIFVAVEAVEAGNHQSYTSGQTKGMLTLLMPPLETMPIEDGPPNTVCGPAALQAADGAAFVAEGLLELPAEVPPTSRIIISSETLIAEAAAGAIVCEDGTTGLVPQQLMTGWRKKSMITAVSYLGDTHSQVRRAYMGAAASEYGGGAPGPASSFMLATAKAGVYGYDGEKGEDLWHMDWRGRLMLSTPDAFGIKLPGIDHFWVH